MLRRSHPIVDLKQSAIQHLSAFEALEEAELLRLERAAAGARHYPARTELTREGGESFPPSLLLKGWLAHQRILPDGRRQIIGFTLPGELFGRSWTCQERALATQVVLNDAIACGAPPAREGSALSRAYQKERVAQRSQLIDNVARLGRMDARERVCDLLLELLERLQRSGEADATSFDMPLTQECFADALGLTPVHLNRTLQACRKSGDLTWCSGRITLHDPENLARGVGRRANRAGVAQIIRELHPA